MEGLRANEINYDNHVNKCRICFKNFSYDERRVDITKTIEKKFHDVTQTNVRLTKNLIKKSHKIH